jgi:hypothetical protein
MKMKTIEQLFSGIERFLHKLEVQRVEAYLSEAQNLQDLERRMRALERRSTFYLP